MTSETLDQKSLRLYPETFTIATCYLCGSVAARWRGVPGELRDTACHACEQADDAAYAAQGGQ